MGKTVTLYWWILESFVYFVNQSSKVMGMKTLQNLKIRDLPYFLLIFPAFLAATVLVSARPAAASGPAEFTLGWDANKEANLDGYEIYYKKGR